MFVYELCNEDSGYVKIKVVLHEIYDSDDKFNKNGISWQEPYISQNLSTAIGKSIAVEFVDDTRTRIWGHGDTGRRNNLLECADATTVGHITNAYITDLEIKGKLTKVVVAEGMLDYYRYGAFIDYYREKFSTENQLYGSVEITGSKENDGCIVYRDGYKPTGRVPSEFVYSGIALLDSLVVQADDSAVVVELNSTQKKKTGKDIKTMDFEKFIAEMNKTLDERFESHNVSQTELKGKETEIAKLNASIAEKDATISNLTEELEATKAELETCKNEKVELENKMAEQKKTDEVNSLTEALKIFEESDTECAKDEINAFKENPFDCGFTVESIVTKIKAHAYDEVSKKKDNELNAFNGLFIDVDNREKELPSETEISEDSLFN